ncbi:flagellar brake domain-containing protein [bacterium]|nr:flagellar brake domain-containing protein [bacterium]
MAQTIRLPHNQELKVWEKVTLKVGEDKEAGLYSARIEDFINGGIVITNPEYVQGRTLLRDGLTVTVQVTREDAAYEFDSRITQRNGNGASYAILTPPKSIRRVQRRLFCRIDLSSGVDYSVIEQGAVRKDDNGEVVWKKSRTIDVSAGGTLMQTEGEIRRNDLMLVRLELFTEVGLPECVVGICRRASKSDIGHVAGIEFIRAYDLADHLNDTQVKALPACIRRFSDMVQERLSRHLFDRQIELRNKGLL